MNVSLMKMKEMAPLAPFEVALILHNAMERP